MVGAQCTVRYGTDTVLGTEYLQQPTSPPILTFITYSTRPDRIPGARDSNATRSVSNYAAFDARSNFPERKLPGHARIHRLRHDWRQRRLQICRACQTGEPSKDLRSHADSPLPLGLADPPLPLKNATTFFCPSELGPSCTLPTRQAQAQAQTEQPLGREFSPDHTLQASRAAYRPPTHLTDSDTSPAPTLQCPQQIPGRVTGQDQRNCVCWADFLSTQAGGRRGRTALRELLHTSQETQLQSSRPSNLCESVSMY